MNYDKNRAAGEGGDFIRHERLGKEQKSPVFCGNYSEMIAVRMLAWDDVEGAWYFFREERARGEKNQFIRDAETGWLGSGTGTALLG